MDQAAQGPAVPPAGWYPDASGVMRWWDGARWTDQAAPASGGAVQRPRLPDDTPVDSLWVWLVVVVPMLTLPMLFLLDMQGYLEATFSFDAVRIAEATLRLTLVSLLMSLVGLVAIGLTVLFAFRDAKRLASLGVVRPFHWAFTFLGGLVYLIGRHVVLRKVLRTAGWPMWVGIAVNVVSFTVAMIWTVWFVQAMMSGMFDALYQFS